MSAGNKKHSVWVVIGCGCLVAIVLVLAVMTLATLSCYRWIEGAEASMTDPTAREKYAMEILGAERLPEGYHPIFAVNVPWIAKIVALSDLPAKENGEPQNFGERGFIFLRGLTMMSWFQDEQQLKDFFAGRSDDSEVLAGNGIHVDVQDILQRGTFELGDAEVLYLAFRGRVGGQGLEGEGISSAFYVQCPDDGALRLAFWIGPDIEEQGEETDYTASAADPDAMASFLGHFDFCR